MSSPRTPVRATLPAPVPDVLVAHLEGEAVLLHLGTREYYRLNGTAQAVWRLLEQGADEPGLVGALTAEWNVDESAAREATERLLDELKRAALVEEVR